MPEMMSDVRTQASTTGENEQLVVDVPHLDLVTSRLARMNTQPTHSAVDDMLGLALLRLPSGSDANVLAPGLRSPDDQNVIPVIGTNPHLTVVSGVIHPYPQPKPHGSADRRLAGGGGVQVGVLDPRFAEPAGPIQGSPTSLLVAGHTALMTALIHAQAPDAIVTVRGVLDDEGQVTAWSVVRGMMALADAGVHVINLSVSCTTTDGEAPLLLCQAVKLLSQRVLLVAAAGDQNLTTWPAALPGVVAVGARQDDGTPADFSPRQPWVMCTAPGDQNTRLTATAFNGTPGEFTGDATWSGTAFAAATASGAVAARTVPGQVTAHDALTSLLAEDGGVVRRYA
jgi:membrane-anchored mycosin MYCP